MYSVPHAAAREAKKLCSKIKSQVTNFDKLVCLNILIDCLDVSLYLTKMGGLLSCFGCRLQAGTTTAAKCTS